MRRYQPCHRTIVLVAAFPFAGVGFAPTTGAADRPLKTAAPVGPRSDNADSALAHYIARRDAARTADKAAAWGAAMAERDEAAQKKFARRVPPSVGQDTGGANESTNATASLGFGGACCDPEGPDYECFPNVDESECLNAGYAFAGFGTSCSSGICLLRCEDSSCDWCWVDSLSENNCPASWNGDGSCDCGCQYCDSDCPGCGGGSTRACCGPDNNVDECINGWTPNTCLNQGGAPQNAANCASVGTCIRCIDQCDWCWFDTLAEGNCPFEFFGDGECDCGCQFCDTDCLSCGPCCSPSVTEPECLDGVFVDECLGNGGLFDGDALFCASADCLPCAQPSCEWCWVGTAAENDCDPAWNGDGACDCGCQFCDADCPECHCPTGAVTFQSPPSGVVDARSPQTAGGIDTFTVRAPAGASEACWSLCTQGPLSYVNSITNVTEVNGRYTLTAQSPLATNSCTVLSYTDMNGATSAASYLIHPGNANADNFTNANDVAALVAYLNGATPPFGLGSTDIDRSGVDTPADIIALIDLLNGAGNTTPWAGTTKPNCGPCLPD